MVRALEELFAKLPIKEMRRPLSGLHAISLAACTCSSISSISATEEMISWRIGQGCIIYLVACTCSPSTSIPSIGATKEMRQPLSCLPVCHLFGLCHLFGCAHLLFQRVHLVHRRAAVVVRPVDNLLLLHVWCKPQPEVVRAVVLEGSPHVLRGGSCPVLLRKAWSEVIRAALRRASLYSRR